MLVRYFLIAPLLFTCLISMAQNEHPIRCIKQTRNFPFINQQGKIDSFVYYTNRVFYYDQKVMVQLDYKFDSSVNNNLLKSETRYSYLVYNKGSKVGFLYDEGANKETKNVRVDSVLKMTWYDNSHVFDLFRKNNITLISSTKDRKKGTLKDEYSIVAQNDTSQKGACYFYYTNKFKDIDFSLSPELDSIRGMKLDSMRIVNDAYLYRPANVWIEKIEFWYKMEEDTLFDKPKILEYFKKYGNL